MTLHNISPHWNGSGARNPTSWTSREPVSFVWPITLHWRHNDHGGVSNQQPHDCLLNRLFRRRSKKTSKLRVTGLCAGNSPETGEFPAQMASNAENVSIWWRHHEKRKCGQGDCPGRLLGRWSLSSTSAVTNRVVTLTIFPFQLQCGTMIMAADQIS